MGGVRVVNPLALTGRSPSSSVAFSLFECDANRPREAEIANNAAEIKLISLCLDDILDNYNTT